jgi:hypothetical protein
MRASLLFVALGAQVAFAVEPLWQVFDSAFPQDFIDKLSITAPSKGIVRFWERGGQGRSEKDGKVTYPNYTLVEINCGLRTTRDIKWDYALEDQATPEGMAARAKFQRSTQELQKNYPSAWESIEPTKHSYARLNFVCTKEGR